MAKGEKSGGQRLPFGGRERLYNVIEVRLRNQLQTQRCDAGNLLVDPETWVVVKTKRGPVLGKTKGHRFRKLLKTGAIPSLVRLAGNRDLERFEENLRFEAEALRLAKREAKALRLEMKVLSAEVMHDQRRVVISFSADERVDFRGLVKALSSSLKRRIEMLQVGVRNGVGMLSGLGTCGRSLCCATHLNEFAPITIKMVKHQDLALNPKKVSGMCGRLMCCLAYEHEAYVSCRSELPRRRCPVLTKQGSGEVVSVDVVSERVVVRLEDSKVDTLPLDEVLLHPSSADLKVRQAKARAGERRWGEEEPQGPGRERRRRGRGRDQGAGAEQDSESGGRRRRRRGKGRSQGEEKAKQSSEQGSKAAGEEDSGAKKAKGSGRGSRKPRGRKPRAGGKGPRGQGKAKSDGKARKGGEEKPRPDGKARKGGEEKPRPDGKARKGGQASAESKPRRGGEERPKSEGKAKSDSKTQRGGEERPRQGGQTSGGEEKPKPKRRRPRRRRPRRPQPEGGGGE